ncbi:MULTISPECIES: GGDEF domain-containing protein [Pseudomonas]|uniref:diguanylate cyclase n=1 Tax=Pseudomonas luteola TaxID=47886 RepID=A0A2X2CS59_PSELU|nr:MULTISPECIES: sensor domain-containing diguanylate cyclase [Pseudomonas]ENA35966.1 diguanylate cyclase (GGDEF) domain-containing protein [Pseudomonas sp. HPB0071]MBF8641958.1 sensor domain-containing diguanylate cyclase [Pseudomonas zeshuii]RRW48705.1 sensor domain-containing diguanylate cyclase [Pseudomonas luteola]SHI95957.1 diguanylate cyclase (GGDEF) domain-containing protein [Pseudomonas zeshuii]SPZ11532.1 GAF sensor-containing diguanylate cyclase [Pseudomonas luteola]
MHAAPAHPREAERQKALESLEILDTPADAYMNALVRIARDLFKVDRVLISLIDREQQCIKAQCGSPFSATARSVAFCAHALLDTHRPLIVPDALSDERFASNPLVIEPPYIRFYAGHPLVAPSGLPIGTLCLMHSEPKQLTAQERDRLRDLAQMADGYLKLRSLSEQTRYLRTVISRERRRAMLDPLTQLWNRAALEHFYPVEQAAARRNNERIGALFIDLDHFKAVNDQHGHAAGDQVLVETAHRIATTLRPHDLLLRLGGEEFAVITRIDKAEQLDGIAERIRFAIADTPFLTVNGPVTVTTSIGGTDGDADEPAESLLKRADAALYQAKHEGRNRVVMASESGSQGT